MRKSAGLVLILLLSAFEVYAQRIAVAPHTNLLLPLFNAGVTVPIGSHLSIDATAYYPWLGHDPANSRCLEARGASLELRWWLAPKRIDGLEGNTLAGHSLAVCKTAQGRGLGKDILLFIKGWFFNDAKAGCRYLTVDSLPAAEPFYVSCDFQPLVDITPDDETILMFFDLKRVEKQVS